LNKINLNTAENSNSSPQVPKASVLPIPALVPQQPTVSPVAPTSKTEIASPLTKDPHEKINKLPIEDFLPVSIKL
jgi:hypothetical protein